MSDLVTNHSFPALTRVKRGAGARRAVFSLLLVWLLASVLIHRLPHQISARAGAPILVGANVPASVVDVFAHACVNCHSENTRWPWYSQVAPISWLVESDVMRAREHLNLSRWYSLEAADQRLRLTAIATVIENREMPPHKYVMFHPEAKLSADDSVRVIEWTRAERRRLRESAFGLSAK